GRTAVLPSLRLQTITDSVWLGWRGLWAWMRTATIFHDQSPDTQMSLVRPPPLSSRVTAASPLRSAHGDGPALSEARTLLCVLYRCDAGGTTHLHICACDVCSLCIVQSADVCQ